MVPSSILGLLLLVWLVTPGFVFNARTASRHARGSESAFQEASRVMLGSVVLSSLGAAVAASVIASSARFSFDPGQLVADPRRYLADHISDAVLFLTVQVVIACVLAVLADAAVRVWIWVSTKQWPPRLRTEAIWSRALAPGQPGTRRQVRLRLASGIEFEGILAGFGRDIDIADREIALEEPITVTFPGRQPEPFIWRYVTFQGPDIEFLAARHIPDDPVSAPDAANRPATQVPPSADSARTPDRSA